MGTQRSDFWLDADSEGRLVDAGEGILAELGYSREQLIGLHVWDITPPPNDTDAREMWSEFTADGGQYGVFELMRADGSRLVFQYRATAGADGRHRSVLSPVGDRLGLATPADVCPFRRPFPTDFDDCNVFDPVLMHQTDSQGTSLAPQWTCRHLAVGTITTGRHYARCSLGSAIDRTRRRQAMTAKHLAIWALRRESTVAMAGPLEELLRARESRSSLAAAADRYLDAFREWVAGRESELAAAGVPPAELLNAVAMATNEFMRQRGRSQWTVDAAFTERLSTGVATFMRPDLERARKS